MRKRPKKRFDHGQPISKIDTRPFAFLAVCIVAFLIPFQKVPLHAFHIDLWDGQSDHPLVTFGEERSADKYQFLNQLTATVDNELTWNGEFITHSQLVVLLSDMQAISGRVAVEYQPHPNASYDWAVKTLYILDASGAPFRIAGTGDHCEFGKGDIPSPAQRQLTGNVSTAHILGNMGLTIALPPEPSGKLYEFTQVFEPCEPRLLVHTPR